MYEPSTEEYLVTVRRGKSVHQITVDDEDYARLINDGACIVRESRVVRPQEGDPDAHVQVRSSAD